MSDVNRSSTPTSLDGREVCVIYDCLFPLTHGGAERWYRCLVDQLVASGANVTYLTRRQWTGQAPRWTGVAVTAVSGRSELYDDQGVRRTPPAIAFGLGTFLWLLRHRRRFDAVVVASFPFFSFLGARLALVGTKTPIFVDYHEVWTRRYWRNYAGRVTGTIGAAIETLCIRLTRFAQVFTPQGAESLRAQGFRGDVAVLAGLLPVRTDVDVSTPVAITTPTVLFVGRHVKHKGVRQLAAIFAAARTSLPDLTMTVVGDGPERTSVEADVALLSLADAVTFAGPVSDEELGLLFARASCTIVPSLREGYGIVVAESISAGTPAVVADNAENLATSLIEPGINGYVVDPSVKGMADGIVAVVTAGLTLRQSTVAWSREHASTKSMNRSALQMVDRMSRHL